MTRFLGVDYGSKRVGLAISDGLGLTARPLEVVARRDIIERVRDIVAEYHVEGLVVGLPTALAGGEGASAAEARALGSELEKSLNLPVVFVDERFTSKLAESALLESGMKRRDRRERVDKVAAAIILQSYLDSPAGSGNSDAS